ncbi:hypothetical protein AAC387_Pa07g1140 [Persea americana]
MPSPTRISPPAAPPPAQLALDSDVVVILAALLCALISVVGLALVARCAWIRRVSGQRAPKIPANKGVKKSVLRSLPKASFNGADNGRLTDCPICLAEFADGEAIRVLPQCGHVFHVSCVDTWLGSHSSCPSCRQVLVAGRCRKCGELPATDVEGKGSGNGCGGGGGGGGNGFLP